MIFSKKQDWSCCPFIGLNSDSVYYEYAKKFIAIEFFKEYFSKYTYMPGVQVSKSDLAHIFGVDQPTIDHWIQRGLPYIRKRIGVAANDTNTNTLNTVERELIFDTADAINWRLSVSNLEHEW